MSIETAARDFVGYGSDQEILGLVDGFRSHTLPQARWTHQAHLAVGLWHVLNRPAERQLEELRRGISSYNESVGTRNTDSGGYHETITALYLWAIRKFLRENYKGGSLVELVNSLLASSYAAKSFPFQYYSRDRLLSAAARRSWIAPDLKPLD
jgi:hypothetical protein